MTGKLGGKESKEYTLDMDRRWRLRMASETRSHQQRSWQIHFPFSAYSSFSIFNAVATRISPEPSAQRALTTS